MKKIIVILASAILFATSAFAEVRMGISAAFTEFDSSGKETVKSSGDTNNKSVTEELVIPSIFIEAGGGMLAVGLEFIPTSDQLGSGTGDNDDAETSGANKASADIESVSNVYLTVPLGGTSFYFKAGMSSADVITTETLATGSTYGNASVNGSILGLGYNRAMDNGLSWRVEYSQTDYDHLKFEGAADADGVKNTIDADVDVNQLKFSLVKAF